MARFLSVGAVKQVTEPSPWTSSHVQPHYLSRQVRTVAIMPSFHCLSFFLVLFKCTEGANCNQVRTFRLARMAEMRGVNAPTLFLLLLGMLIC